MPDTMLIAKNGDTDHGLHKDRNRTKRFVDKLRQFSRVAKCYDKLLAKFTGCSKLAAIAISLG